MKHRTGHLFKRGTNFYVRWTIEGKVFSKALRDNNGKAVTTRREAEEARQKIMAPFAVADEAAALESIVGKLEGRKAELAELEEQKNPPLLISQAWAQFKDSPNRQDTGAETLYQYECQFSAFAEWMKEKHPEALALRDVTKEIAEEYASTLNGGRFSPNTYNKHRNLLALVFRVTKHKAKLASNPWEEIQRKKLTTQHRRPLTFAELRKISEAAEGELRILLALGIYTGLRLGDCATLRWAEVDLEQVLILRIPNKTARRKPEAVRIPIHATLLEMLSAIDAEKRSGYVLPEIAALYERRIDLVTDLIQRHFKTCGIAPNKPGKNGKRAVIEVGFHSLRHSFVSMCRASNVPLSVVESIVGHSNPSMTQSYTHTDDDAAGRAVATLPAIIGEQQPKQEDPMIKIRQIAQSMTSANWKDKRASLLALLESGSRLMAGSAACSLSSPLVPVTVG